MESFLQIAHFAFKGWSRPPCNHKWTTNNLICAWRSCQKSSPSRGVWLHHSISQRGWFSRQWVQLPWWTIVDVFKQALLDLNVHFMVNLDSDGQHDARQMSDLVRVMLTRRIKLSFILVGGGATRLLVCRSTTRCSVDRLSAFDACCKSLPMSSATSF